MYFKEIVFISVDKFLVLPENNSQQKAGAKALQQDMMLMPSPTLLANTAHGSLLNASSDIIQCGRFRTCLTVVTAFKQGNSNSSGVNGTAALPLKKLHSAFYQNSSHLQVSYNNTNTYITVYWLFLFFFYDSIIKHGC